MRNICSES